MKTSLLLHFAASALVFVSCVTISSSVKQENWKISRVISDVCGRQCGVRDFRPSNAKFTFFDNLNNQESVAVFFNISINKSKDSTLNVTEQLLRRWVWVGKGGKFLLTLPFDFDIRSSGTLTHKVHHQTISVVPYPRQCYQKLNKTCKVDFIARFLAEKITSFPLVDRNKTQSQLCRWAVQEGKSVGAEEILYECCRYDQKFICDQTVQPNIWITYSRYTLWVLAGIYCVFTPFMLKYCSQKYQTFGSGKFKKSRSYRRLRESRSTETSPGTPGPGPVRLMSYDDDAPVGLSSLFCFDNRSTGWAPRIMRFALLLIIVPILLYLQTFVYFYYKSKDIELRHDLGITDVTSVYIGPNIYISVSLYLFSVLLACVMISLPKSFADLERRLTYRRDERFFLFFKKPEAIIRRPSDKQGFDSLCQTMLHHFSLFCDATFWRFLWKVLIYPIRRLRSACNPPAPPEDSFSRLNRHSDQQSREDFDHEEDIPLCVRCLTMSFLLIYVFMLPVWMAFVFLSLIIYVTPLTYLSIRIWRALFEFRVRWKCCNSIPVLVRMCALPFLYILFLVFCVCVIVSYFVVVGVIALSLLFLANVIGFTLIGFILYIDFYAPYVIVSLWGVFYISKYYYDYRKRYKKFQLLLFDICETETAENTGQQNSTIPGVPSNQNAIDSSSNSVQTVRLVYRDVDNVPCIPVGLFSIACRQVLPIHLAFLGMALKSVISVVYITVMFFFLSSLNVEFDPAHGTLAQDVALFLVCGAPLALARVQPEEYMERHRFSLQNITKQFITDLNNGRLDYEKYS